MALLPSPTIVVCRHGDFASSIGRARILAADGGASVIEFDPATGEIDDLEVPLGPFGADEPVRVVVLVGDLDEQDAAASELVSEAERFTKALNVRFPTLRTAVWFILRLGPEIGNAELQLVRAAEDRAREFPFAVTALVTSGSGASHAHDRDDLDRQIGDVVHLIAASDLERTLTASAQRTWAIGVGSVVYRPDGFLNAAIRSIDGSLARLADGTLRDPSYSQGTRWVADRHIGPPSAGEEREDAEARLLLVGPGRGSVADDPARELRRLDASIDVLDPGLWAGVLASAVDVATAPRTHPNATERSPLVIAIDHVHANLAARKAELAEDLENEARRILEEQQSIPSADGWCEGARAAIQSAIDELAAPPDEEPIDLAERYRRLSKAARDLPYSSSLLVRGLLIVVLMLVVGYVYAPVGTFVAWAFSKRVFWFGDTLEQNARTWARITAAGAGALLWLWWEAKWRRIRRFRRRYVAGAEVQMRRMVEEAVRSGRIHMLHDLLAFVGTPDGEPGTLRRWLRVNAETLEELRRRAAEDKSDGESLMQSRWAAVIPSEQEPSRVLDGLDEARRARLASCPLDAIRASALNITPEASRSLVKEAIEGELPSMSRDLRREWTSADAIGEAARQALTANLWSGLPDELASRRGATRERRLVASPAIAEIVEAVADFSAVIPSQDPNFVSNLWTTPVLLLPPDEDGAG